MPINGVCDPNEKRLLINSMYARLSQLATSIEQWRRTGDQERRASARAYYDQLIEKSDVLCRGLSISEETGYYLVTEPLLAASEEAWVAAHEWMTESHPEFDAARYPKAAKVRNPEAPEQVLAPASVVADSTVQ
jgi:hypothetical protein